MVNCLRHYLIVIDRVVFCFGTNKHKFTSSMVAAFQISQKMIKNGCIPPSGNFGAGMSAPDVDRKHDKWKTTLVIPDTESAQQSWRNDNWFFLFPTCTIALPMQGADPCRNMLCASCNFCTATPLQEWRQQQN